MSRKVMDAQGRWRSKTVSLRMSPEENTLLGHYAKLSGMTKQDYMIARLLQRRSWFRGIRGSTRRCVISLKPFCWNCGRSNLSVKCSQNGWTGLNLH